MHDRAQLAAEQWQQQRPDLDGFSMAVIGRLGELNQIISRESPTAHREAETAKAHRE